MRKNCSKFNDDQLAVFLKQLASLLKAGLPLYKALQVMAGQNEKLKAPILKIAENLAQGKSFSLCLKEAGISQDIVSLVSMGEKNAVLETTLQEMAGHLEVQAEARKKIKRALVYPGIVLSSCLVCLIALVTIILPMFSSMFEGFNVPLPLMTLILLNIPRYWWLVLLIITLVIVGGMRVWKRDDLKLKVPIIGKIQESFIFERFCRTLGHQLKNGVPILEAVSVTREALPNSLYRKHMNEVAHKLENGQPLAEALESNLFASSLLQIVAVGEETSTLHSMLIEAADFYRRETETAIKQVTLLVEPLSTLLVGGVVALVAFAMLSPLFALMNSFQ